ncbi:MAG: TonB-dependent receptor [Alphaproteobacteria bacterium]
MGFTTTRRLARRVLLGALLTSCSTMPFALAQDTTTDDDLLFLEEETTTTPAPADAEAEASVAVAPAQEPEPVAEPVKRSGPKLDEIIVTAQKRAEDVQDVPLSVTAISGDDIKEKDMSDLSAVASQTPNMNITYSPTFNFISMRGLGSGWNRGFEQSVAIIIDEVYYGRPAYLSNGQLDLAGIEVLRGPQGTLFGKNAVAGVMHLRTALPENEWTADVDGTYGEDNYIRLRGAVGGPLFSEDLSFRVAIMKEERDGIMFNTTTQNEGNNLDNLNYRVKLRYEPSSDLNVLWSFNGGSIDQLGNGSQPILDKPRFAAGFLVFDPAYVANDDYITHKDFDDFTKRDFYDSTLHAEFETNAGTITSVSNYAQFEELVFLDADFGPMPILKLDNNEDYTQYSTELRFTSEPGTFEYVAGVYYLHNEVDATYDYSTFITIEEALAFGGAGELILCDNLPTEDAFRQCRAQTLNNEAAGQIAGNLINARQQLEGVSAIESSNRIFAQESDSFAAFGQFQWEITEAFALTVGARASYEEKSAYIKHTLHNHRTGQDGQVFVQDPNSPLPIELDDNPLGIVTLQLFTPGITQFEESLSRDEFDVSPKASIQYRTSDDFMAYFTWAKGFKGGGFNAQPNRPDNLEFEEETSTTYELGFKSEWFEGAGRLNVSSFYTAFKGLQVSAFNGVEFVVDNAADATVYGVEWEAMLVPLESVLLTASGAYTSATYDEFTGGPCKVDTYQATVCDLSGDTLTGSPEWQLNFSAVYDGPVFNSPFIFHIGADTMFETESFINTDNDPINTRPEEWNMNARIGIRSLEGTWSIMAFGENLFDNRRYQIFNDTPAQDEAHEGILGNGRVFKLQARYFF